MNRRVTRSARAWLPWLTALLLLLPPVVQDAHAQGPATGEHRVALVIGNADYKSAPLLNAVNDSRAMSAKLRTLGFEVIERENLTHAAAGETLREFRSRLRPGSVALFFYAGHGVQVNGINYLPLTDSAIASEEDVPLQSLSMSQVLDVMEQTKTRLNLVFLDACRDNPYARGFRSATRGLAKIDAPSGTIIAFATRPGAVASDGKRKNGLYTEHLLANIDAADIPVEQMLKRVVREVKAQSRGLQEPWMEGSIEGDFYFKRGAGHEQALESQYWDSIKDSRDARDYDAYLERFPEGTFAGLARSRIAALRASPAQGDASNAKLSNAPEAAHAESPDAKPRVESKTAGAAAAGTLGGAVRLPNVGSSWTYRIRSGAAQRTFSVTVKSVSAEAVEEMLETLDGEKFETVRRFRLSAGVEEGVRETLLPGRYVLSELAPYLDATQLQAGRQWSLDDNRLIAARGASTWPVKLRVAGADSVAIAAGTFNAIRIEGETPVRPVAPGKYAGFAFKFWYVPALGRVARVVRTTVGGLGIAPEETCELVSYRPQ